MNDNAKKWVAALRSGEFEQTQGRLRETRGDFDHYCCLGVACVLARRCGVEVASLNRTHPPINVVEWLGLSDNSGSYWIGGRLRGALNYLTNDNDNGKTFQEIADIIESEPEGLFVKEAV